MSRRRKTQRKKEPAKIPPVPSKKPGFRRVAPAAVVLAVLLAIYITTSRTTPPISGVPAELRPGAAVGYNVLVITLDTTRADHLGCYGFAGSDTPVLDGLAAEGLLFGDAVSSVPMTMPAHASIFTGLDPDHHGVRNNGEFRLAPSHLTLAEVLQQHGYATAAFVSTFVLDSRYGLDQGFEKYDAALKPATEKTFAQFNERSATAVTDAADQWLRLRERDRPFFAWVHYFDAHDPYEPPAPFSQNFLERPYDGEIAYVDSQIGRLLKALEHTGLRNQTLIVVVGDHGESLGEHDERKHSLLIYEATQHVPLILACAGLFDQPHVVDDVVVSIVDVFPTILDLLDIRDVAMTDGVSLLVAPDNKNREVYVESMQTYLEHGWAPLFGLRRHEDKFILAPRSEYYDLRKDPKELRNLFADPSRQVKTSVAELQAKLAKRVAAGASPEAVVSAATTPDAEALQRLASLGYVSGAVPDVASGVADPKDMMATWETVLKGQALLDAGNFAGALIKAKAALAMSQHDRAVLQLLGQAYAQLGEFDDAEAAFRAFTEIKPSASVYLLLAQIIMAQGRNAEAEQLLDQAAQLEPKHGGVFIARGDLLMIQGRFQEALAAFTEAERVDPYRASGMAQGRLKIAREVISSEN